MILIAEMLGVRREDRDLLQHWSDQMISGSDGPENVTVEVIEAHQQFMEYTGQIIEDRRKSPHDDLISTLVHAEIDGDKLTQEELLGESLLLLVGGNETTRNVISGSVEVLSRHPGERAVLREDPSRLPVAVEECLRWVTPIINMARTATRDVQVRGKTVRAGQQILLMYGSANRDEAAFDWPDRFNVGREPNPHVAFGFGAHFCLGNALARIEIKVVLEELLRRMPDIEVAPGFEVWRTPSSFIRGITSLPVVFTPEAA
ncbi:MAG: cytochrome P450, partial [Acidimicrobiales bacterium]